MCSLFLIKKIVKYVCGGGEGGSMHKKPRLGRSSIYIYITRNNKNPLMRLRYFILTKKYFWSWKLENIQTKFSILKNWTRCYHGRGGFYSWSRNRMRLWTTDSPYFLYNTSKSPSSLSSSCKSQVNFPTTKISLHCTDNSTFWYWALQYLYTVWLDC